MQKLLLVYYYSAKSRCKPNLESTSKYDFFPRFLGGKNGGIPSMRMQVILDSSFRPPGFSPYMWREERRVPGLDYITLCLYPQILQKALFPVSLGTYNGPKRKQKQCLCKIWGDKQRVLCYFPEWPITAAKETN